MSRSALSQSYYEEEELEELEGSQIESEEFVCSKETFAPISNALPPVLEKFTLAASIAPYTESPIEVLFGVEFITFVSSIGLKFSHCEHSDQNKFGRDCILLMHQFPWKHYRIDWAIKVPFLQQSLFFVECDGRDFHSSEAQVARDKLKDSEALKAGVRMFRFTGSDLERSAATCARLVYDEIEKQYFSEKRASLPQVITRKTCRGCHFKVEVATTFAGLANALKSIYQFHSERGISVRQGPPEHHHGRNQEFVRWYFENVQDADIFRKRFGGRLICSPGP
jgi:very-short-patch-repair endonuclease